MTFLKNNKLTRVVNALASAGNDTTNSSVVDMQGFNNITFLGTIGTTASGGVVSIVAQGSADNSTWADLTGTSVACTAGADSEVVAVEVVTPRYRYMRCTVIRTVANSSVDGVVAVQSGPASSPVTQPATTVGNEVHLAPAAGTA